MNNLNFRAWHKEKNRMYPVDGIMHYDQGTQIIVDGDISLNLEQVILMQSTGLKDSKGVEIFEGDILAGEIYDTPVSFSIESVFTGYQLYVIVFDTSSARFLGKELNANGEIEISELEEIVANIYEQPELLGGGE